MIWYKSISARIVLIVSLALAGLLVLGGVSLYLTHKVETAVEMSGIGNRIAQQTLDTLLLEQRFINSGDLALIDNINDNGAGVKALLKDLKGYVNNDKAEAAYQELTSATEAHQDVFVSTASIVKQMNAGYKSLSGHASACEKELLQLIKLINQTEAMLMIDAEELPVQEVALRDFVNQTVGVFSRNMISIQGLMLNGDEKAYLANSKTLAAEIDKMEKKVSTQLQAVNNADYSKVWQQAKADLAAAGTLKTKNYHFWKQRQRLAEQLKQNSMKTQTAAMALVEITRHEIEWNGRLAARLNLGVIVVLVLGLSVLGFFIGRSITTPIKEAVSIADSIASGDLDRPVTIQRQDEIGMMGDSMRVMIRNLKKNRQEIEDKVEMLDHIIAEVAKSADRVSTESHQISDTSQTLSQGATEQAATMEEIGSSMNEISAQATKNADNSTQAQKLTALVQNLLEQGTSEMTDMSHSMEKINQTSQEITKITKAIDSIAFQTNILALNAAVEAARAGSYGKGFAVVAEEVRQLAQKSADAAHEAAEIVTESKSRVEAGLASVGKTATALKDIQDAVDKVIGLVGEVATASTEQAQGIEQMNQAISQTENVIQQNTAVSEESASAAHELAAQADKLNELLLTCGHGTADGGSGSSTESDQQRAALPA